MKKLMIRRFVRGGFVFGCPWKHKILMSEPIERHRQCSPSRGFYFEPTSLRDFCLAFPLAHRSRGPVWRAWFSRLRLMRFVFGLCAAFFLFAVHWFSSFFLLRRHFHFHSNSFDFLLLQKEFCAGFVVRLFRGALARNVRVELYW